MFVMQVKTIEMLGGLDKFSKVFDIDDYKKNNRKAHLWLLANKNDHYAKELNEEAKRLKIISTSEKIEARIRAVLRKFKPIVYHFKDNK